MKTGNTLRMARNSFLCFFMALAASFLVACGGGGSSILQDIDDILNPDAPDVPGAPSATAQSESEIEVAWSAVPDATIYRLYRSESSGGAYAQVGGDISALSYLDTGRSASTEYFYQLEACRINLLIIVKCSGRSPEVSVTTASSAFLSYLSDAAVQGVEYSGPTGDGLTGKGGVFLANEGVFEFSIGGTTLGSVQLNIDWEDSHVTPADFMGVDEEKAIDIARIMQGLDDDGDPQNGISISQSVRDNAPDLFPRVDSDDTEIRVVIDGIDGKTFIIPPKNDATEHFVATRRCLFSGGYAGSYRATVATYNPPLPLDEGQSYFVLEPFANRIRGVEFSTVPEHVENDSVLESFPITVGAIGSVITLSPGNELSFVTPRLVTGIWAESDGSESGTYNLTLVAGNPGATRRVVGVETENTTMAVGLYVLDYFEDDSSFSGQYYDVETDSSSALLLTIAGGGSWPTAVANTPTALTLSGTLGGDATAITVGVIRVDGNYGTFAGAAGGLSGTWCDIGGATDAADPPPPPMPTPPTPSTPSASAQSESEILVTWSAVSGATIYKLYRSTVSGVASTLQVGDDLSALTRRYLDSGRSAETEYFYQLEACNSAGCSGRSPEVSATTQSPPVDDDQCRVGQTLMAGENCEWKGYTFSVGSDGRGSYAFANAGTAIRIRGSTINGVRITFVAVRSGDVWEIEELGPDSPGVAPMQPPVDGDQCRVGQRLMVGESCEWKEHTFSAESGGLAIAGPRVNSAPLLTRQFTQQIGSDTLVATRDGTTWTITRADGGDGNDGGAPPDDTDDGQCSVGDTLMAGESCEWKGHTFTVRSDGRGSYAFFTAGTAIRQSGRINGVQITFVAVRSGNVWEIEELGPDSPGVAPTQPPARPPAPSASAQSDTEIEVTWSAVSGAATYKLYRSTSRSGGYAQIGGDISALRYLDRGRSAGTEYFYQLEACNSGGCSSPSPQVSVTTQASPPVTPARPARPARPSASAQSESEIEVTWSAVSGATTYKLYRSANSGRTYTQIGGDISALRYLDRGRSASTQYFYQLEACNSGGCSSRSPADSATTQSPPVDDGQCSVGDMLRAGESCEWKGYTFRVASNGRGSYAFFNAGTSIRQSGQINGVQITFVAVKNGNVWEIEQVG